MKWVRDMTGRFAQRPYYDQRELDFECEDIITSFLIERHGKAVYPIATDELTILLERVTSDLDLGADLSAEGADVEGVTDFLANAKPRVRLARELSDSQRHENRLRTTLTHELGHVKFHNFQWMQAGLLQPTLFGGVGPVPAPRCKRANIIGAGEVDWMEWQAGYASGAFLMPYTPLCRLVQGFLAQHDVAARSRPEYRRGLIGQVQTLFRVSQDAARVRLSQLNFLSQTTTPPLL
jgi:hypothetical protein